MPLPASSSERPEAPFALTALAASLSDACPGFLVWKAGGDLDAEGDLDAAVPRSAWPAVGAAFDDWARRRGLAATVVCGHAQGMRILVGCGGAAGRRLLQVDLVDRKLVHGVAVWTASDLAVATETRRGVRSLRPGAEGMARVLADRSDELGAVLVRRDPASARALGERLGVRGRLAARSRGRLALEAVLALPALGSPVEAMRVATADPARRRCAVLRALAAGRRAPEPLEGWLDEVAASHEVIRHA